MAEVFKLYSKCTPWRKCLVDAYPLTNIIKRSALILILVWCTFLCNKNKDDDLGLFLMVEDSYSLSGLLFYFLGLTPLLNFARVTIPQNDHSVTIVVSIYGRDDNTTIK